MCREMLLENVKDVECFLLLSADNICQAGPMICGADYLRVNPQGRLWGFGGRGGGSASERDRGRAGRSLFRANEVEDGVEGVGEACMGTEVDGELHRLTANGSAGGADAMIANVGKELDLRLAEQIDRLHGIANEEAGTVLAGIPGGEESGNQLVLSARRILELVNEQMAEIAGNVDDALRRFLENEECGEVQLGEVHLIVFSEDHAEFGYGLAQDREDVAKGGPLGFGIVGGRQAANGAEGSEKFRSVLQPLQQVLHIGFALPGLVAVGGKALTHVDGFAPFVFAGEEEIADAAPVFA